MSVSARTNDFGEHGYTDVFPLELNYVNADYPEYSVFRTDWLYGIPVHGCSRSGHSNNKPRLLTDAGPLWRDPSDYSRTVADLQYKIGRYYMANLPHWTQTQDKLNREWFFSWDFTESRFAVSGGIPWPSDLESEAIVKAMKKLKGKAAQIGEDLAEAGKTYRSLTQELGNLARALYAMKRGDAAGALRHIKDGRGIVRRGADLFLQYKYGWKPIVSDIYGLAKLLQDQCKPALLKTAKVRTRATRTNLIPVAGKSRTGGVDIRGRLSLTGKVNSSVSSLPDHIGLSNPLSLGWELIPYSFVVDWFIPIGDILDAMTPPLGLDFVGGSCSFTFDGELHSVLLPEPGETALTSAETTCRVFSLLRTSYSKWPKPGLYTVSPFTPGHGFSSLALALQKMFR
jgi:hypothetical protein